MIPNQIKRNQINTKPNETYINTFDDISIDFYLLLNVGVFNAHQCFLQILIPSTGIC